MGFIRKILSSLIVAAILSASTAYVVSDRLLNFKYLEQKANAGQFYPNLAAALPQLIAGGQSDGSPVNANDLKNITPPVYVQTQINSFLEQTQNYYQHNGPAPTLDLSQVVTQARAAGIVVPPGSSLDTPVVVNDPGGLKAQYARIQATKLWAPIIALVLLIVLMVMQPAPARYRSAGKVMLTAAISVGILYVVALFLPGILVSVIKSNQNLAIVQAPLTSLISGVGSDMAAEFLKIVIGLVVLAVGFFLFGMFGHKIGKSGGQEIKRPSSQNRPSIN